MLGEIAVPIPAWLDLAGIGRVLGVKAREVAYLVDARHATGFPRHHMVRLPRSRGPVARWSLEEVERWRDHPLDVPWTLGDAWPVPEVASRPADDAEIPSGARSLMNAALPGWTITPTYSRGCWPVRGKPGPMVDTLALRFHWLPVRGYGLWVDSRFKGGAIMDGSRGWPTSVNATQIRVVLRNDPSNARDATT